MEFTYNGLKVSYLEMGQGPLVVLFHGWGANKELFKPTMEIMATRYHVIAPDIPGFGESEEPSTSWNLDDYCAFAKAFIEEMAKRNILSGAEHETGAQQEVILGGHSHGGRMMIKLVGREDLDLNVTKLLLIDSAGLVPVKTPAQLRKIKRYKMGKKILSMKVVKLFFPHALEKLQSKSGSADYRAASPIMRESMVKVVNEDVREYLPNIKAETLLIWGDLDTATPLSDGQFMESQIPGSGLAVLNGAGHYCFIDRQFQFLAVIKSFLQI